MERIDSEVLIAGGGMVGLTLAAALGGAGIDVTVIDPMPPADARAAAFDGRTSAIAFGSKRILDGIGAWAGMAAEAEPILQIRVSDGAAPLFLHYDHAEVGEDPLGWIVENRHIRIALHDRIAQLPNVRLLAPARAAAVERGRAGVEARLADGRVLRARLLVGADGRASAVRKEAGIAVTAWSYRQVGLVCTIAHEHPHRGIAHERFLAAGPLAMLPMRGNRSSIVWTERADLAPAMMALADEAFADEVLCRFGPSLGRLAVEGGRWSYPLALMHAERYVDRRLALVGDAAHLIHPIAGQGLNLGLRDVAALAEEVVDAVRLGLDAGDAGALEAYQRARRIDNTTLMAVTDGMNRLFSNAVPPVRLLRDLGLGLVNGMPVLRRFFMRHAMGTVGDLPRLARGEPL